MSRNSHTKRCLLRAPDNRKYEVSWNHFRPEELETYNWNHLDHYIVTRGDQVRESPAVGVE